MIEVFKIVNDIYDEKVAPILRFNKTSVTRGNKFKLYNQTFIHNFRKYFFSARIVNIWNSLPNWVVDVQSIDLFKVRLDRFDRKIGAALYVRRRPSPHGHKRP